MKSPFYLIVFGFLLVGLGCSSIDDQHLNKSKEVENWLQDQKIENDGVEIWVDEVGKEQVSLSLSNGVSGKVLFYLELYLATNDEKYLGEVIEGCHYLQANLPKTSDQARSIRNASSLYGDISGSAFVLMEAYNVTGHDSWKKSVYRCLSLLDSSSMNSDGRYWNKSNDVLTGIAGTGLLLLYLHQELEDEKPLKLAIEAAEILEQRAVRKRDSLYWSVNQDTDMNLPNFSHGAAGIGYFYARLYEETNDPHYLDIANQVAKYLELIAWKPNNSFLLPYGFPDYDWERDYDIGWAHGPAGVARFFYKLWQVTNDDEWLNIVRQCANGIKFSGLPGDPNNQFGTTPFPIDMRFGLGGVLDFYIGLAQQGIIDKNDLYLSELVASLDKQSIMEDSTKRYWSIEKYGFMEGDKGDPGLFTGYFYGSAGLGLLHIKLFNMLHGKETSIKLPDNPF